MLTIPEALAIAIQHHQAGRLAQAEQIYRQILAVDPSQADAWHLLGLIAQHMGQDEVAVVHIQRAIALNGSAAVFHNNLSATLWRLGRFAEAAACCRRALQLKPDDAHTYNNLGMALRDQGRPDEAWDCFCRALELAPDFGKAHCNRATLSLLRGDLSQGWEEYKWRWKPPQRRFSQPAWSGEPLGGKTILLYSEQGLGDTIHYIRYAAVVKRLGATVIVEHQPPLHRLLAACPGVDCLVAEGTPLPPFDLQAPLLSVPCILNPSLAAIPCAVPYLQAEPERCRRWRQPLEELGGLKIGINWCGAAPPARGHAATSPWRTSPPWRKSPACA